MEIDLLRLMRAVHLDAQRTGYGVTYIVSGGERDHLVALDGPHGPECNCYDFLERHQTCKHILRALLAEGEPVVVRRLRFIVPNPDKHPRPGARRLVRQQAA